MMDQTQTIKEDYLGVLDGIRGLMAFWVFFEHLELACIGKLPKWGPAAYAVDVFMFLSGFLMAYHWKIRSATSNSVRRQTLDFYVRRFFRIAPLYYLLLTIVLVFQSTFFSWRDYVSHAVPAPWAAKAATVREVTRTAIDLPNVFSHYSFLYGLFPQYASSNVLPDWSIGLEMQFYAVFPFLMLGMFRFGPLTLAIFSICVMTVTHKAFGLYLNEGVLATYPQPSLLLFKITIFIGGMCAALAYLKRRSQEAFIWLVAAAISLIHVALQVKICIGLILGLLFLDPAAREGLHRILACRWARFLGDTSYSLYLGHRLILIPAMYVLLHCAWYGNLPPLFRLGVAFMIITPLAYLLAYLLFRFIELPGIRIGRTIANRLAASIFSLNLKQD